MQNISRAETTFDSQSQTAHTQSRYTVQERHQRLWAGVEGDKDQRTLCTRGGSRLPAIGLSGRTDPFFVYVVVVMHV